MTHAPQPSIANTLRLAIEGTRPPATAHAPDAPTPPTPRSASEADSLTDLLQSLGSDDLDPAAVTQQLRQRCVAHLSDLGYSAEDLAASLKVSLRTIKRDRAAIRRDRALKPGVYLGDELLGEYRHLTRNAIRQLTLLSQDPRTPPYARLWAQEASTRMYKTFFDTVNQLNYFSDGKHRLADAAYIDPEKLKRDKEIDEAKRHYRQEMGLPQLPRGY